MAEAFEAIALVEIESISRGYATLDVIAKRAGVNIKFAKAVTPGKFLILFGGDVASTQESLVSARETASSQLLDELWLPQAHHRLLAAVDGRISPEPGDAIGVFEFHSVAATLLAADLVLKGTAVGLAELDLAVGIGGKGYFNLAGDLADIEAAVAAVSEGVESHRIAGIETIPQPHKETRGFFV